LLFATNAKQRSQLYEAKSYPQTTNKSSLGQVVIAEFDDYNDKSQVLNNPDLEWPLPLCEQKMLLK